MRRRGFQGAERLRRKRWRGVAPAEGSAGKEKNVHVPLEGSAHEEGSADRRGHFRARPGRGRFSEETVDALLRLQWWNWPPERIRETLDAIRSGHVDELVRV